MPNQFHPLFISRKTAIIGILNMIFIIGQCTPSRDGLFFNNDSDHKASSITSEDPLNNYPLKRLSIEKNKSPTDDDMYLSVTKHGILGLSTYSSLKNEPITHGSLSLRIRKREDDEESIDSEEKPNSEPGENEEAPKPEPDENEDAPKPESVEEEESPLERHTEDSISLSTSNLEEYPMPPTSDQEDMSFSKNQDTSDEDFAFQKNPLSSDFLKQAEKPPFGNRQKGKGRISTNANGYDSDPSEFLTEESWDEYSANPLTFPSDSEAKKSGTIKPPRPIVSWNEFLVMQDKFQKEKQNLNPTQLKNNIFSSSFHKSKENMYSFLEDAIRRNKQIEKELMDLKRMLQKSASEHFHGHSQIINNTLQLNLPFLQKGKIMPQEFKIRLEAESPLKIKTQVGDEKGDTMSFNSKHIRLGERSSENSNTTSNNKIQVRAIPTSAKMPDMLTVSAEPARDLSSTVTASNADMSSEAEDDDPLKAERTAFIRKGAEFLRRAWFKYKQKRFLQY